LNDLKAEYDGKATESKTTLATPYKVQMGIYTLTIIDTPGFGDTRGMP